MTHQVERVRWAAWTLAAYGLLVLVNAFVLPSPAEGRSASEDLRATVY